MNELSTDILTAVKEFKSAIVLAQARVSANANAEMLSLYFGIGRYVSHKTKTEKWGTGVIDSISAQLQKEMPGLRGFSSRNIRNMRKFYESWGDGSIWQTPSAKLDNADGQLIWQTPSAKLEDPVICSPLASKLRETDGNAVTVAQFLSLSFSHHLEILSGANTLDERLFYIREAALNHWNLNQLSAGIKRDEFHHRGAMPSNFMATIPDKALARKTLDMFRDEYLLDFVNLDDIEAATGEDVDERVVEKSIVANIRQFITEFGKDFSFIGNQYRVEAAGHEHFIDLLFFNRELNALVAVATYRTADEMPENLKRALPPIDELRKRLEIAGAGDNETT